MAITKGNARKVMVGLALFLAAACGTPPPASHLVNPQVAVPPSKSVNEINESLSIAAAQSHNSTADYRIGPDDLVQITLYNIPQSDAGVTPRTVTLRVSQQGAVVLPLIGSVEVKGMTTADLERELTKRYAKYIRSPQIGALITEYRQRASVMGAVQKPGVFDLTGPRTVIDMLAEAGGLTDKAGNQVIVYRKNKDGSRQSFVIDLMVLANSATRVTDEKSAAMVNMPIAAGDVINVPQAGMFFVDGAVGKPGSYPLGRQYTLTQALATAGGVNPELADYSEVSIYRRQGPTQTKTIAVNLDNVMAGAAPDPSIHPDDVIVVPMSSAKYFVKRFIGTIVSGVSIGSFVR